MKIYGLTADFVCPDREKAKAKLERILGGGTSGIHFITDFDRTMTPFFDNRGQLVSTWDLFTRKMPADMRAEDNRLYGIYRPLEVAGKLTPEDALKWWAANLDLFEKSRLKWIDLVREIENDIPVRPGTKEVFAPCGSEGIPTAIVSAGTRDVIEVWCHKFDIHPNHILSTKLNFDERGYISGWDRGSLVHIRNKGEVGKTYLESMSKERPYAVLLGDSLDDAAIVDDGENALRIYVDDRQEKKAKGDDFYDRLFDNFDLALQNGSLAPVVDLLRGAGAA
ncbi:MAG: HAD-IB family phosphatase [Candidatus Pacebacteria bacterium]|jgi:HAD superfamily phosphoserine phosphatase-like hydrolase|nr:HAD-IB family phosphatase [Candidatus Paceibacterota bacterium]